MRASGRIAMFLPSLAGGGAERVFVCLANEFVSLGRDVDLVLLRCEGPYLSQVDPRVRIVGLDSSNKAGVFSLARLLRREPPEVLISAMDVFNLVAIAATFLSRTGTPLVITLHLHLTAHARHSKKLHVRVLPPLAGRLYRYASAIIAVSHGVAEDAAAVTRLPKERIRVVHNPLMLSREESAALPHAWLTDSVPVVVSAGRFDPQKDYDTLLHAFARVIARRPARLILLGDGPDRARIERTVADLGLAAHVALPGFVKNPFDYYSLARVFVLSSHYEGFGMVLAEALSCGCPVISTDCPSGPAEILGHGTYGRLVPVGDVDAMATAVEEVIDAPVDRSALKTRAAEFAVQPVARKYLEILDLVAQRS